MSKLVACVCDRCNLRFPGDPAVPCPRCHVPTTAHDEYYQHVPPTAACAKHVEAILDNVRSVFNVGSIFRTADAAGIRKLHLAGITPTPAHPKMTKTSLGAEKVVSWDAVPSATELADQLIQEGHVLWALESTPDATSIFDAVSPEKPVALVVGNEVAGVDPALLERAAVRVAIPMAGTKVSLNVATAFGVAAYRLCGLD